jgi:SulP family sulfate permease
MLELGPSGSVRGALSNERPYRDIERQALANGARHVLLRVKRVRNPDVVSLESFEQFLKGSGSRGIRVWVAGLQPDLLAAFERLHFSEWAPRERLLAQGVDEDSATLAAIRRIRAELAADAIGAPDKLYYLV